MKKPILLSLIIPAKNEQLLITKSLKDVYVYLKNAGYSFEILVVVNGSNDKTEDYVEVFSKKRPEVLYIESAEGYGIALRTGLASARGKYVAIFNVDFYDLHLLDFVKIDLLGKDFIIGSKLSYWSDDDRPVGRHLLSKLLNILLRISFGFRGSDTHGIKIGRASAIRSIMPKCTTESGIFDSELIIKAQKLGYKLMDYPVEVKELRPSRFAKRFLQTPRDLLELFLALSSFAENLKRKSEDECEVFSASAGFYSRRSDRRRYPERKLVGSLYSKNDN